MFRLGVLGGTFDPPHIGHLILAQCAFENLKLNKIIFIPAGLQPHKLNESISPARQRLEMLKLALVNDIRFEVSTLEIDSDAISYTYRTLQELKKIYPDHQLYFIMGGDNITDIETWKNPDEIFRLARVAAAYRLDCAPEGKYSEQILPIEMPQVEISSTQIRQLVKRGKSAKYLVPDSVAEYIDENKLYR